MREAVLKVPENVCFSAPDSPDVGPLMLSACSSRPDTGASVR